jgi:hypothetical protein
MSGQWSGRACGREVGKAYLAAVLTLRSFSGLSTSSSIMGRSWSFMASGIGMWAPSEEPGVQWSSINFRKHDSAACLISVGAFAWAPMPASVKGKSGLVLA